MSKKSENICGAVFKWEKFEDVPIDDILKRAFECGTPKVWTWKPKLGDLYVADTIFAIIGADTKKEATHVYMSQLSPEEYYDLPEYYDEETYDFSEELEGISKKNKWQKNFEETLERIVPWNEK